jgi:hypothetical protein
MKKTIVLQRTFDEHWDSYVTQHPDGWLTHTADWKKVIEKSFGHIKGYCFCLVDKNYNDIIAGIPAFIVDSYISGKRLVSIPFATICDPLADNNAHIDLLVNALIEAKEQMHCKSIEVRSSCNNKIIKTNSLYQRSFFIQHFLRLDDSLENIFNKFHRTCTRQRINRANKSHLKLKKGYSEYDLKIFYKLYTNARKRLALPPMPFSFIKNLLNTFFHKGYVDLFLALKDSEAIAGLLVFKYKKRFSIEFAASNEKYWSISPNHFLFWEAIKIAHAEGYEVVDFGRTASNNKSLMDFKGRWGTQTTIMQEYFYPANVKSDLNKADRSLKKKALQYICKNAPAALLPTIGKICYRHLG